MLIRFFLFYCAALHKIKKLQKILMYGRKNLQIYLFYKIYYKS